MDDLQEVFEGWLRSRVGDGPVTEGGYETDVEGMRRWRSDCSEFLVWLQANEPEMFGEFRYRYSSLDSEGWKALVGFAGGFHDKPSGPPDESQLESDLEALVDNPVGEDVPAPTVTTPAPTTTTTTTKPPTTTTTTTVPPTTTTKPPTTTTTPPPTTTKPPRTIPVTPDTGPEVTAPPTTTEPPFQHPPVETIPSLPEKPLPLRPRPPGTWPVAPDYPRDLNPPEDEGSGRRVEDGGTLNIGPDDWGAPPGTPAAGGEGFEARPHTPHGPFAPRRPGDWPWPGGSAGRAIVENLELSTGGQFLAVVLNDLFDWMNSKPRFVGFMPELPSTHPGAEAAGHPTVDENGRWVRPDAAMMSPAGHKPLVTS